MSWIHYEPDPAVVPCIGCNQRILEEDLLKVAPSDLYAPSTFFWYPFHFWCVCKIRWTSWRHCVDCGLPMELDAVRRTLHWSLTFRTRVRLRYFIAPGPGEVRTDPSAWIPRPAGLRMVVVPAVDFDEEQRALLREVRLRVPGPLHPSPAFAFVHDLCPVSDRFVDGLVANGPNDQLLTVYQDALLERGDAVRAEFVGVARERSRASISKRTAITVRLRELRDQLPGAWCRAVLVGDGSSVRRLE